MVRTKDVVRAITKNTDLTEKQASAVVTAFFNGIQDALATGESVSITHLGRFKVHEYPSKSIPDPRGHGHHLLLLPKKVVKFKPALRMRKTVETRKGKLHQIKDAPPTKVVTLEHTPTAEFPADFTPKKQPSKKKESANTPIAIKLVGEEPQPAKTPSAREKPTKNTEKVATEDKKGSPNWLILFSRLKKNQANQAKANAVEEDKKDEGIKVLPELDEAEKPAPKEEPGKDTDEPVDLTTDDEVDKDKYKQASSPVDIAIRDLSEIQVEKETLNLLPELFARRHQSVAIEANDDTVTVAMVDPQDLETIQLIKKSTSKDVVPVLASNEDIDRILNQYSGLEAEVADVMKDSSLEITKQEIADAQHENVEESGDDSPTSRIVLSLLKRAVREKASDVHIEPYEKAVVVRFRIDGVLRTRVKLPKEIQAAVISRLKILGNLKIDEHRLPQDGRFRLDIDKNMVDFRLSTLPVADGEKAVMRILDKSQGILSLEEIGVRGHGYDIVKANVKKSYGMTLVTGPTGSGKTTTLYALLGQLIDVGVNIVTLEEPIEYRIEGINQSQVMAEIGYTFASGLRAIVRQDPDIIMVGEVRDKDTAEIAIQSALTGHIVLSTLHTNTAAGAVPRLIDMGVEPFLIASSLNTVIAQRLARRLCSHCEASYTPSSQELSVINEQIKLLDPKQRPSSKKKYEFKTAKGCDVCNHTGYTGRIGLFEVLDVSGDIETHILNRSTDTMVQKTAVAAGMVTMLQDGILKAIDGLTSLEEVWRVTRD